MAGLPASQLVNITLRLQASAAGAAAFGIPLIVDGDNVIGTGAGDYAVTPYTSLADMTAAGYKPWNAAYKMAKTLLTPLPTGSRIVPLFKVGTAGTMDNDLLSGLESADASWYWLLIPNRVAEDIGAASDWCVSTATNRHLYIAETNDVDCYSNDASVASGLFAAGYYRTSLYFNPGVAQVVTLTPSAAFAADASITLKVNGISMSAVPFATSSAQTLTNLATAIAALAPVDTATVSSGSIIITANDPLVDLYFSDYAGGGSTPTTATFAVTTQSSYPLDAAVAGVIIPLGAGLATLDLKTLPNVVPANLTGTQAQRLKDLRCNYYVTISGYKVTQTGTVSSDAAPGTPLFADLVAGSDSFYVALQQGLIATLAGSPKLPYTDAGIATVVNTIDSIARTYVASGFLQPYKFADCYTIPRAVDVSGADRSNRVLNGLVANYKATGAIQTIGDLTINIEV